MKRSKQPNHDYFGVSELSVPRFGAGEVAEVLGIENWRLQKFLSGKSYRLSAQTHIGTSGQGSRRLFCVEDIYRIGIANFLVRDGFAPKFVSEVLQQIEDRDLLDFDEKGRTKHLVIAFRRGTSGPVVQFGAAAQREDDERYYEFDTSLVIDEVDRRVKEVTKKRRS
jgi:hypothetical protein